ncbi:hypothetical protein P8452_09503 [Trifolium repens]|nr:hypothetical protein P8452_09503 [Trifolium repens]
MEGYGYGYGSDHGPYGNERRIEIVSGRSYGLSQNYYASRRGESFGEVTRASHDGAVPVAKPWSFNDAQTKRRKRIARANYRNCPNNKFCIRRNRMLMHINIGCTQRIFEPALYNSLSYLGLRL